MNDKDTLTIERYHEAPNELTDMLRKTQAAILVGVNFAVKNQIVLLQQQLSTFEKRLEKIEWQLDYILKQYK